MTGASDDSRGRVGARPWIVVGSLLALGAAGAMVFTADSRWLRLGIVAALWAALLGAFLATRNHRRARVSEQAATDAQAVYELELEREVAARREHELEAVSEARSQLDSETRDEVESLRDEVTALRDSLQQLMGGELLYERVALTAQSTRMRQVGEQAPPAFADVQHGALADEDTGNRDVRSALEPGASQRSTARQTEVFGTVPAAEQRDSREADVARQQAVRSSDSDDPMVAQPQRADVSERSPRQPPQRPQGQPAQGQPAQGQPAQGQPAQPPAQQPPRAPAAGQQRGVSPGQPRTDVTGGSRAHQPATARSSNGHQPGAAQPQRPGRQPQQARGQPPESRGQPLQSRGQPQQPAGPTQQPAGPTQQPPGQTQQPAGPTQQPPGKTQHPAGPTQQPAGQTQQPRRQPQPPQQPRQHSGQPRPADGPDTADSRRQGQSVEDPDGEAERAEAAAAASDESGSESSAEPSPEEVGGSHAEGRSVSELLAAYGSRSGSAPHRRRRAQ